MQVMILEEDPALRTQIAGALAPEGVDILSFGRLAPAKEAARRTAVDVLVLGESAEGRFAHDLALLAERRNPRLGSILLSDRGAEEAEELFDLIPSLQAVLARRTGPRTLARVALATARSQEGIAPLRDDPPAGNAASAGHPCAPLPEEPGSRPGPAQEALASGHDIAALVRSVLAEVEAGPQQDVTPWPALSARALSVIEMPTGRLHVLPSFLRETGDWAPPQDEGASPTPVPVPLLAALSAPPMRRLNLA